MTFITSLGILMHEIISFAVRFDEQSFVKIGKKSKYGLHRFIYQLF